MARDCVSYTSLMPLLRAILLVVVMPAPAIGQTNTGEIAGIVGDSSRGVLPGATVTARHPASGTVLERVTDAQGRFFLPSLRIGSWNITATLRGFTPQTRKGIVVELGRTLSLEFTLGVQGVTEEVIVEATPPLLQTRTAEISDVVENREIVQLPLNGRNFIGLAQLSDAVVIPPAALAAPPSSRPDRCPTSGANAPVTTFICSTA